MPKEPKSGLYLLYKALSLSSYRVYQKFIDEYESTSPMYYVNVSKSHNKANICLHPLSILNT